MMMNLLIFPKLKTEPTIKDAPLVSVLVPARNEAKVIARTVENLLKQTYTNYEIIILDDKSEDNTGEIALDTAQGDARLRVISGLDLPNGWMGKSWACHNLAQSAKGDILVFTDADVQWGEHALNSIIVEMQRSQVDMLTVWSTQITKTFAEQITVPLMGMVILGYLPTVMVHHSPFSLFAAANGQLMAWRKPVYDAIEGHKAVANNVLDDVTLARIAKKNGYRIRMIDGNNHIKTRMYDSWQNVRDGYAKNILAGYGSIPALLLGTVFHWLLFILPYALLLIAEYRLFGVILIIAGLTLRIVSAIFTKQRAIDALWMPLTVILFTLISFRSIYWHYTGKVTWKGRTLTKDIQV